MHVVSEVKFVLSQSRRENVPLFSRYFVSRQVLMPASLACASLLGLSGCREKVAPPPPQPPDVTFAEVVQKDVPVFNEWVAQLNGPVNADITPKVQGYLLKQNYQNGYYVKKGQLLYEIDPRPFVAALDQSKAQVAVAVANRGEAENNVTRDRPLAAQNAIPQKQLDTDVSTLEANKAQVTAAMASQANSELNLEWTKVYAPIDGVAGNSVSNVGDLVGTSTKMTTISQVNPIWAYFNISERDYLANAARINATIRGGSRQGVPTNVKYIQANGEPFPAKGEMILVSRAVSSETGTLQIAAAFPNKDGILRPGGFGRVRVQTGITPNALLIPQAAVIEVQSLYQVIVLTPENKALIRPIKVGERVGQDWIITDGLNPGERVVVDGSQRVQAFAAASPEMAKEGVPVAAKPYTPAPSAGGGD
jgi:membrane fusion protein, multidrug efflux system